MAKLSTIVRGRPLFERVGLEIIVIGFEVIVIDTLELLPEASCSTEDPEALDALYNSTMRIYSERVGPMNERKAKLGAALLSRADRLFQEVAEQEE
jgi:hypothetical protein